MSDSPRVGIDLDVDKLDVEDLEEQSAERVPAGHIALGV